MNNNPECPFCHEEMSDKGPMEFKYHCDNEDCRFHGFWTRLNIANIAYALEYHDDTRPAPAPVKTPMHVSFTYAGVLTSDQVAKIYTILCENSHA